MPSQTEEELSIKDGYRQTVKEITDRLTSLLDQSFRVNLSDTFADGYSTAVQFAQDSTPVCGELATYITNNSPPIPDILPVHTNGFCSGVLHDLVERIQTHEVSSATVERRIEIMQPLFDSAYHHISYITVILDSWYLNREIFSFQEFLSRGVSGGGSVVGVGGGGGGGGDREEEKTFTTKEISELAGSLINAVMTVKGFFSEEVFDQRLYCKCEHQLSAMQVNIFNTFGCGDCDCGTACSRIGTHFEKYLNEISISLSEFASSKTYIVSRANPYLDSLNEDISEYTESQRRKQFDHYRRTLDSIVNAIHVYCIKAKNEFSLGPIHPEEDENTIALCESYEEVPSIDLHDPGIYDPNFGPSIGLYDYTPEFIPNIEEYVEDEEGNTYSLYEEIFGYVQVPVRLIGNTGDREVYIFSPSNTGVMGASTNDWEMYRGYSTSEITSGSLLNLLEPNGSMKQKTYCVRVPVVYGEMKTNSYSRDRLDSLNRSGNFGRIETMMDSTHRYVQTALSDYPFPLSNNWTAIDSSSYTIDTLFDVPPHVKFHGGFSQYTDGAILLALEDQTPMDVKYPYWNGTSIIPEMWKLIPMRNVYELYKPTSTSATSLNGPSTFIEGTSKCRVHVSSYSHERLEEQITPLEDVIDLGVSKKKVPDIYIPNIILNIPDNSSDFVEDEDGNTYSLHEEIFGGVRKVVKLKDKEVYISDFRIAEHETYPWLGKRTSGLFMLGTSHYMTGADATKWNFIMPLLVPQEPGWQIPIENFGDPSANVIQSRIDSTIRTSTLQNATYALRISQPWNEDYTFNQDRVPMNQPDIEIVTNNYFWCTQHNKWKFALSTLPFDLKGEVPPNVEVDVKENLAQMRWNRNGAESAVYRAASMWRAPRNLYLLITPIGPDAEKLGQYVYGRDLEERNFGYRDAAFDACFYRGNPVQPSETDMFLYTAKIEVGLRNARSYPMVKESFIPDPIPERFVWPYV